MAGIIKLNRRPTLEEAQSLVDGYVAIVELENGDQLLVNDDGLALSLPLNHDASILARQPIVGEVVLLQGDCRWKEDE